MIVSGELEFSVKVYVSHTISGPSKHKVNSLPQCR